MTMCSFCSSYPVPEMATFLSSLDDSRTEEYNTEFASIP